MAASSRLTLRSYRYYYYWSFTAAASQPLKVSSVCGTRTASTDTGPSANLECRSERCCTRLAANTGPKNVAKNRHLGTIPQLCRAISSQLRHVSTIGKKLLSSNISSACPHNMVHFGPLAAGIVSLVLAPQVISTGFASWHR